MRNAVLNGLILIGTLVVFSLNSWGSEPLPQLSIYSQLQLAQHAFPDTIPVKANIPEREQPNAQKATETVIPPVVKQVPKSRKKLKPAAVTPSVKVPPAKIIKPNVVIKKINVKVL